MMRVPAEPFDVVRPRMKLPLREWQAAIDEKLRLREYELAGYEPLPGITLSLAKQNERK